LINRKDSKEAKENPVMKEWQEYLDRDFQDLRVVKEIEETPEVQEFLSKAKGEIQEYKEDLDDTVIMDRKERKVKSESPVSLESKEGVGK
jgi:hypothetical protein